MNGKCWAKTQIEREDLTARLTHLIKNPDNAEKKALDVLVDILRDKTIKGSTTKSGFIVGNKPAVCFREVPIHTLAQVARGDIGGDDYKEYSEKYNGYGIRVNKFTAYQKGARPVFYGETDELKSIIDEEYWWRIVN